MTDLKTLYRENFRVLCKTVKEKQADMAKMIRAVKIDDLFRLKEHSVHLLRKTHTPSGLLYHIRIIDNVTDRCVLQGPVLIPAQRKTKK